MPPLPRPYTCGPIRRAFGAPRGIFAEFESKFPEMPLLSKLWTPIKEGRQAMDNFVNAERKTLLGILNRVPHRELAGVMGALISRDAAKGAALMGGGPRSVEIATKLEAYLTKNLLPRIGLSPEDGTRLLKEVIPQMREARGDFERIPHNIIPTSLQPFFEDARRGELHFSTTNPTVLAENLMNLVGRRLHLSKPREDAVRLIQRLRHQGGKPGLQAAEIAQEFLDAQVNMHDHTAATVAEKLNWALGYIKKLGVPIGEVNQRDVDTWAMHATSWYSGVSMAARPALALRDSVQVMLPATMVGYEELGPALRKTYGRDGKFRQIAGEALGLANDPLLPEEAIVGNRVFRQLKRAQDIGQIPRKFVENTHNRVTTFWMGHQSISKWAPKLVKGELTLDEFLMNTGLAGSYKADQEIILAKLRGETVDVEGAARAYGKQLVDQTQFVYGRPGRPSMFQGTPGRILGQFGIWPTNFAELLVNNLIRHGTPAWRARWLTRFAAQKTAFWALGAALGIDTTDWNFANPLTFQGGPYAQVIKDLSILATSPNEYERRGARAYVQRMAAQIANPFGGLTTDIGQAQGADDPLQGLMLLLGFSPYKEAK